VCVYRKFKFQIKGLWARLQLCSFMMQKCAAVTQDQTWPPGSHVCSDAWLINVKYMEWWFINRVNIGTEIKFSQWIVKQCLPSQILVVTSEFCSEYKILFCDFIWQGMTCHLTRWSGVLERLIATQLTKKYPASCGTGIN
jgi:hypothetical protein